MLSPIAPQNKFQGHLYDKYPDNTNKETKDFYKKNIPKYVPGKDVDNNEVRCPTNVIKWLNSM